MTIRPLNSVAGFSVGEYPYNVVIQSSGDITAANVTITGVSNLNSVSNVIITGGNSGQFLSTDGTGNLSWATLSSGSLFNGNSNVQVLNNSNITFSSAGNANVVVITDSGENINGYLTITGVTNVANSINANGNIKTNANIIAHDHVFVGNGAQDTAFNNPTIIAVNSGSDYVQAGLINTSNTGSADWIAYGDNGNDIAGWSDFGFTGSNFNDPAYTITGKNDGYFIVQPVNGIGLGGNLVFATGNQGANRDIVFATGGFSTVNEKIRLIDAQNKFHIKMSTAATSTTTGALVVDGGVGVSGNIYANGKINAVGNIAGANVFGTGYVAADRGLIAVSTYNGPYSDGIVVDYQNGNARFSAGAADGFKFFNNGTGNVNIFTIDIDGSTISNGNVQANNTVLSNSISAINSNLTLSAGTGDKSIRLKPSGTGTIDANNARITSLSEPSLLSDAATKNYVDNVAQGLAVKQAVVAATTTTLAVATGGTITYNNGSNGIGATLTTTGAFNLIDTANIQVVGSRLLVKNEANSVWNGIYTYANFSSIVRSVDFDNAPGNEIAGAFVFVQDGNVNKSTGWVCTDVNPVVVGTTPITFTQFSGAGTYTAGTGLTLTGSTFSVSNTTVTSGNYGSTSLIPTFTVNPQGQLTAASSVAVVASASTLSGTTLNSTIITSNLTTVGNLSTLTVTGTANVGNIISSSNVTGLQLISNVATGTAPFIVTSTTQVANLNVANAGVAGYVTAAAQSNITSVGTLLSLSVSGNANIGNIDTAQILASSNITAPRLISNVSSGTSPFVVSSNTKVANLNADLVDGYDTSIIVTANTISVRDANGNISANYFTGNGSQLTGLNTNSISNGSSNVSIATIDGNVTASVAGTANILVISSSGANVTGTFTAANITATTGVFTGNGSGLTNLVGSTVTGQVNYAAVANSVAGSNVSGAVTFAVTANSVAGANVSGQVNYAAVANSVAGANVSGQVDYAAVANSVAGANVTGAVALATYATTANSVAGANVSGQVNYAATANSVAGANVTGTVSSATNATSLQQNTSSATTVYPTFTTLSSNGNSQVIFNTSVSANLGNASISAVTFVGNIQGGTGNSNVGNIGATNAILSGNLSAGNVNVTGQLVSTVATGTAPISISSTTKITNLNADLLDGYDTSNSSVANTIVVRDSNANVAANYFIGNGSQLTGIITSVSNVTNGTSNINIPASGGNVNISVGGNANVLVITGTGANITGTANVTGNVNMGANASVAGNLTVSGGIVPRVVTVADGTSITPNIATTDIVYQLNTQVTGTLTINTPTGTPVDGQRLMFRLKTANQQTLSFASGVYYGSSDLALPTGTTGSSFVDYMGFIYDITNNHWEMLAKNFGF